MKPIVHVFNSTLVSGPETLALPALAKLGSQAVVIFLTENRKPSESEKPVAYAKGLGIVTRTIQVRSRIDRAAIRALASLLQELDPGVAHAHDVKASTYLERAARLLPARCFALYSTHHGVRGRRGIKDKLYERFYSAFVLPKFDRVLTVCTSDRTLLLKRGLDPERVRVHLNGVDRRRISPAQRAHESQEIRSRWRLFERGIPADSTVLGIVGRLASEKRIDRSLKMAAALMKLKGLGRWDLVIFGTGPLEQSLRALAVELGIESRVHWLGYRQGLGDEFAGFDILLSLSDAEGLPINLIESGWAGTPVFATAVDGNLDLMDGKSSRFGMLVDPLSNDPEEGAILAKKIATWIIGAQERAQVGRDFQERVETHFSGERWLRDLVAFYQETASQNSDSLDTAGNE